MKTISENIKFYRKQRGYSQTALAKKLCVTPQAVSRWENGHSMPDVYTLAKLAQVLKVEMAELVNQ
ncbi:MAG: helix-turn-helix transcriptional regulator [Clostridia bacterium]|nr:helix-turn-helix transcriptional regulator [Clostridia bacterium]